MKITRDNKIIYPKVIDFRINSECHYNCEYCYGPKLIKGLPFKNIEHMIKRFKDFGCEQIVVTGGEPLLHNDIEEILELIHSLNMKISLSTTGKLFSRYATIIDKCVQHIGLPIDFGDEKVTYRKPGALQDVLNMLDYYKIKSDRPIIKIGTVCTRDNLDKLNEVGELLSKYKGVVDVWKIYQFVPFVFNTKKDVAMNKKLEVSSKEFPEATKGLKTKFSKFLDIIISPRDARGSAYFFIDPNGDVFVSKDDGTMCKDEKIGNLVTGDWDKIFLEWSEATSMPKYKDNIKKTFKFKI